MKSAGKARSNGLYRHIRTSKEIIRNLLNYYYINKMGTDPKSIPIFLSYLRQFFLIFSYISYLFRL